MELLYPSYLNSQDQSNRSCTAEQPADSERKRRIASTPCSVPQAERSPPVAMEPPGFDPPHCMESARVGEMQQNVLLEVLGYCRLLHAAVHRLEQKVEDLQAECRNRKILEEPTVSVGGAQLSHSLAQRLGPSPQAKLLRDSEGLQDTGNVPPLSIRGKRDKRRRRRAPRASETQLEPVSQVEEKEPGDHTVQKNNRVKWWRKKRKRHAAARSDLEEATSMERNGN